MTVHDSRAVKPVLSIGGRSVDRSVAAIVVDSLVTVGRATRNTDWQSSES